MPTAPWSRAARFIFGPAISPQRHPVTPFSRQWNRFPPRPLKRARGPSTAETGHADDILQSADHQTRRPPTRLQVSFPVPDAPTFRATAGTAARRSHDHRRRPTKPRHTAALVMGGQELHLTPNRRPPATAYRSIFRRGARTRTGPEANRRSRCSSRPSGNQSDHSDTKRARHLRHQR